MKWSGQDQSQNHLQVLVYQNKMHFQCRIHLSKQKLKFVCWVIQEDVVHAQSFFVEVFSSATLLYLCFCFRRAWKFRILSGQTSFPWTQWAALAQSPVNSKQRHTRYTTFLSTYYMSDYIAHIVKVFGQHPVPSLIGQRSIYQRLMFIHTDIWWYHILYCISNLAFVLWFF